MYKLNPYSREELLTDPGRLHGPAKVQAILRVALAVGDDFDPEYFEVLTTAAKDPVPEIRVAAAWSTVYLAGPQSLALVADMAANDPDDAVRTNAAALLDHFSRSG
jgi:hypothetical protein